MSLLGWILIGVGGVLVLGIILFLLLARSRRKDEGIEYKPHVDYSQKREINKFIRSESPSSNTASSPVSDRR